VSDLPVCGYCGGPVVTCPHLYYLSQIVSVPPSADAVTGHPLPASTGSSADASVSSAGTGTPRRVSGHQLSKEVR
jgi:hypothetical protein